MTTEEWRDIPGFGGHYEVSSLGRVRSKTRVVIRPHSRTGRPVRSVYKSRVMSAKKIGPSGHRCITLTFSGKERTVFVHTLVLLAFSGPCPEGMECRHLNGDPLDNRPCNLKWGTHLENSMDRQMHGHYARGEDHAMAVLTEQQVVSAIRRGLSHQEMAEELGITPGHAWNILNGKSWKHLKSHHDLKECGESAGETARAAGEQEPANV